VVEVYKAAEHQWSQKWWRMACLTDRTPHLCARGPAQDTVEEAVMQLRDEAAAEEKIAGNGGSGGTDGPTVASRVSPDGRILAPADEGPRPLDTDRSQHQETDRSRRLRNRLLKSVRRVAVAELRAFGDLSACEDGASLRCHWSGFARVIGERGPRGTASICGHFSVRRQCFSARGRVRVPELWQLILAYVSPVGLHLPVGPLQCLRPMRQACCPRPC
jgi:hypothetical protein